MAVTRYVAAFIAKTGYEGIPEHARHLARRHILDGLGVMLAGSTTEGSRIIQRYLAEIGGNAQATIVGTGQKAAVPQAAFANGAAAHAMDHDDTQLSRSPSRVYGLLTHPTTPVLGCVLPLAESLGYSGRDLLVAYSLGVEVECKIAEAMNPRHYQEGFHSTGTVGALGAAAAACKLLGLDEQRTAMAMGIAASESAGLRENFGTMTKPFHAGRASENGVVAAKLAAAGFTAATNILEARRGFFNAAAGGYEADKIEGSLGRPWSILEPGVSIKPYPSGSLSHPALDVVLDLRREYGLRAADVEWVKVGVNSHTLNALIHPRPITELQAKFSLQYCMAVAILDGAAGLAQFTDERVNRADVQELLGKVSVELNPEMEARGFHRMASLVEIGLKDGRLLRGEAEMAKGSPEKPMTDEEVAAKFRECAVLALPLARIDEAVEAVWRLDQLVNVRQLPVFEG